MKKIFFITALLAVSVAVSACHTVIPIDESSAAQSDEASSAVSVESTVNMSEEPSSEENSRDAESSEAPSVPSYESSETFSEPSSEETSEEPSEEPSETSEEPSTPDESSQADDTPVLGSLFAPYYRIMKSGKYMLKTVESKIVGGEAMPYTTTIYRDGDKAYITIEESYGATSELLIRDGSTYWLDGSVFAYLFLFEAKRCGFKIQDSFRSAIARELRQNLNNQNIGNVMKRLGFKKIHKKNGNGWAVIEKEGSEINNDAFIDPNDTVED